jgi:hypothetical protein
MNAIEFEKETDALWNVAIRFLPPWVRSPERACHKGRRGVEVRHMLRCHSGKPAVIPARWFSAEWLDGEIYHNDDQGEALEVLPTMEALANRMQVFVSDFLTAVQNPP